MGHSSSKIPQRPLPNILIDLSTPPDKVYRPADIVNGNITLAPNVPLAPDAIEVSLFGKSLVWYRTATVINNVAHHWHWRDNGPLFEITSNVLPNPHTAAPLLASGKTYTYPFQFRFPASGSNSRSGQYKNDHDTRWTVDHHMLPPSFLHISRRTVVAGEDANYAKIEYGVRARLKCPGIGVAKGQNIHDLEVTAPVLFVHQNSRANVSQDPPIAIRHSKPFSMRSSALMGQASSSIGFCQHVRDRLSSSTPKLDFEISLEIPKTLASGSELCLRVFFNVLSTTESASHLPTIQFTILKLDLQELTVVRAPLDKKASDSYRGYYWKDRYETMPPPDTPFSSREFVSSSKEKTHLNSIPPSATLNLQETPSEKGEALQQANSCDTWFKARIPGSTPPSFKSFAIARTYMIKVKIGIEIGGKQFEYEVKSDVEMDSTPEYYPDAALIELAKGRKDNKLKKWEQKSRWLW